MKLLEGKKALVAGVANKRSIAWGVAQALHAHGAQVAFTCVEGTLKRVTRLAEQMGSDMVIPCDVSSDENIANAFAKVGEGFGGKLDILVHSIAYANLDDMGGEFIKVSRAGWKLALDISAYSLVALARAARPLMIAAGGGSVMTMTYAGGRRVTSSYNIMGIAKAALECSVRYLAYDLGPDKIRVNAISPGPIETISSMVVAQFSEARGKMENYSPLLRSLSADDIGDVAVFYASDLSKCITGTVLDADCGMDILGSSSEPHPRSLKKMASAPSL